jgi:hypothetical protein
VRKAGNRVRVTAQLIDSTTGGHVWAERFDRMGMRLEVARPSGTATLGSTGTTQPRPSRCGGRSLSLLGPPVA